MNASNMKLENRHGSILNNQKSNDDSGTRKSRSPRKKVYGSGDDKDALVISVNNGLGHPFYHNTDPKNVDPAFKPLCTKRDRLKKDSSKPNMMTGKIQDKLQSFISSENKEKILGILNDIRALSDVEKLYLYLQLPTGNPYDVDPFKQKMQNPLGKKADEEGSFAITWIQSHLEEDPDVSLPKQEVYDEYQSFCTMSNTDPLCAADFGKVMKQIFPSVKPRRLGTRGNSRYCYSGLRKKIKLETPMLPDIQIQEEKCVEEKFSDEATAAASHLLLEWAEKLLGSRFRSLKELAAYLLENMYVDSRSVAAFTLWLESSNVTKASEGNTKKSEAQFQLQRKIQEKELLKEQKKKLEEQRNCIVAASKERIANPKKKTPKAKKAKASSIVGAEVVCDKKNEEKDQDIPLEVSVKEEDCLVVCDTKRAAEPSIVVSPLSSPQNSELEDPSHSTKVFISQSSCTLPNIIIVPQLASQTSGIPKYKRIQPKPLEGELFSSVLRSRAGSVGSSMPSKPKVHSTDGRRSSFACLQSDSRSSESGEEKLQIGSSDSSSAASSQENKSVHSLKDDILYETSHKSNKTKPFDFASDGLSSILIDKRKQQSLDPPSNQSSTLLMKNSKSVPAKRQLEEKDDHINHKRVHLDSFQTASKLNSVPGAQLTSKVYTRISQEEVNVHEIEGDALIDYFQKGNGQNSILQASDSQLSTSNKVQQLSQLRMLLEQNLPGAISKSASTSSKNQKHLSSSQDDSLNKTFLPVLQDNQLLAATDLFANQDKLASLIKDGQQINNLEDILRSSSSVLNAGSNLENGLVTDPSMFLNCEQEMEVGEMNPNLSSLCLPSTSCEIMIKHENAAILNGRISTCTQVPSVPQSPNTRRRAFNFMPISPRHTPVPDGTGAVPSPQVRTMASIAVGPSQPPSNSGSPFVSPRSTPVPLCRSRHSSGQSTYSTSRHTPFQSFDSGVSSVSTSPFISPQPTPVPVGRLRHNTGNSCKTVTFSSVNSPQVMHPSNGVPPLRTRHSSGPGATIVNFYTTQTSALSPLVSDSAAFVFPPLSKESRSRHNSGSNPLSPLSEHASSSSSCVVSLGDSGASQSFINDGAGDLLISANPTSFRQVRHRHASSSVLHSKSSSTQHDIFSQEIQKLLKNYQENGAPDIVVSNRSQSVPLHQMLQVTDGYHFLPQPMEDIGTKSHPSTPINSHAFSFSSNQTLVADNYAQDKAQMDWVSLDGSEMEPSSARRNLTHLYDESSPPPPPISDDLQTTLDDLRECDTVFSKLELELKQSEENTL